MDEHFYEGNYLYRLFDRYERHANKYTVNAFRVIPILYNKVNFRPTKEPKKGKPDGERK